jgi:uncharacterized membrane protein (DUF106 family)
VSGMTSKYIPMVYIGIYIINIFQWYIYHIHNAVVLSEELVHSCIKVEKTDFNMIQFQVIYIYIYIYIYVYIHIYTAYIYAAEEMEVT